MNWNAWARQIHRWMSILFTLTVIANFVQISQGKGNPPNWITYSPLAPLLLLFLTGSWLFLLPYVTKWRRGGASTTAGA